MIDKTRTQLCDGGGNPGYDEFRYSRGKHIIILDDIYIYFVFAIWYSTEIIFNTSAKSIFGIDIDILNNSMNYMMLVLLMVQIVFFQKYDFTTLVRIFIISGFMIISVVLSKNRSLLATWMFIVAAQNIDMDRLIRLAEKILIVLIPSIMMLCYLGVLEDAIIFRGNIIRHSLGFVHCNQLGLRIFQLVLCILYLHRNDIKIIHLTMIALAAYFCYKVPNSQTATIVLLVLFVLMILYVVIDLRVNRQTSIYILSLIPGAILANALSVLFSTIDFSFSRFFVMVDMALSTRISSCYKLFKMYGVTFFGNRIYVTETERELVGITSRLWLDNAYMFMLLRYGIITFLIFSTLYIFGMIYYKRLNENIIVIILFLYSVYGIMETGMIMMQHNIFLLALGMPLYYKWFERDSEEIMV